MADPIEIFEHAQSIMQTDQPRALQLLRQSADQGFPVAQNWLGHNLATQGKTAGEVGEGMKYLEMASDAGYHPASGDLARIYSGEQATAAGTDYINANRAAEFGGRATDQRIKAGFNPDGGAVDPIEHAKENFRNTSAGNQGSASTQAAEPNEPSQRSRPWSRERRLERLKAKTEIANAKTGLKEAKRNGAVADAERKAANRGVLPNSETPSGPAAAATAAKSEGTIAKTLRYGRNGAYGLLAIGAAVGVYKGYEWLNGDNAQSPAQTSSAPAPFVDHPLASESRADFAKRLNEQISKTGSAKVHDSAGGDGYFEIAKNQQGQYELYRLYGNGSRMDSTPMFSNDGHLVSVTAAMLTEDPTHRLSTYAKNPQHDADFKDWFNRTLNNKSADNSGLTGPTSKLASVAKPRTPGMA